MLRVALIRCRPRFLTDVPAVMLFDLRDDVKDIPHDPCHQSDEGADFEIDLLGDQSFHVLFDRLLCKSPPPSDVYYHATCSKATQTSP